MIGAVIHPITVKMDNNERISGQDDSSLFLFPAINMAETRCNEIQ